MADYRVVGASLPRLDALPKVRGQAQYVADIARPHLLHGKILRSPLPHARIRRIDATHARKVPGVKAVITGEDTPKIRFGDFLADEYILAVDKVRFVGDEVAAVAATEEEAAQEAIELIEVEYEELPAVFDPEAALEPGAPLVHEAERNIAKTLRLERGDVDAAFRESDLVLAERFTTSFMHHAYLEPTAVLAEVYPSGRLTLWLPTQKPFPMRTTMARALGLHISDVKIIQPEVGGAFGGKMYARAFPIAALLALKTRRPVRIVLGRMEDIIGTHLRAPVITDLKMGIRRDGTLTGKRARIYVQNGAYTKQGTVVLDVNAYRVDSLYRIHHIQTEAHLVYTNCPPTGAFRGFGNPQGHFAVESMVDMLAAGVGMDPMEVRLKNATQTGDITVHGWEIRSCGLTECILKATALAGWSVKRARSQPHRGIGIACGIHASGNRGVYNFDGSTAVVKVELDGSVTLLTGEADTGQGARTVLAQIAAEELGVGLDVVRTAVIDTDVSPYCLGASASRVTTIGGGAVKLAAAEARRQLLEVAAELLEANPADLEVRNGRVVVRGNPERGLPLAEVAKAGWHGQGEGGIIGKATFDADSVVPDETKYGNMSNAYSFVAQVAEVEVDPETGRVRVLGLTAAHDLGKAINPALAEGQIEGGLLQGLGTALTEGLIMEEGRFVNGSFADYKVPSTRDMPEIAPILVESNDPKGPFGAKGLGEPTLVPTAPAITNAIYHATGIRITDLPVTPEKLLKALRARQGRER